MAQTNSNLHNAKNIKNDEFYTMYNDIAKEIVHYKEQFKDKIVYCNCDSEKSNFVKYLTNNFKNLGLKSLIATSYNPNGNGKLIFYNGEKTFESEMVGNGDFRSEQCIDILKRADIVVTNPPFSLFREYMAQLMEYGKKFLILGNMNAVTYKEIFPYIKNGKLWFGKTLHGVKCSFIVPSNYDKKNAWIENGVKYAPINNAIWFTNLETNKQADAPTLTETYKAENYSKYDNYDAINIDKIKNMPYDYNGAIGVPITIIDKICSDGLIHFNCPNLKDKDSKYKIIKFRKGDDDKDLAINGYTPYFRILIQKVN